MMVVIEVVIVVVEVVVVCSGYGCGWRVWCWWEGERVVGTVMVVGGWLWFVVGRGWCWCWCWW